MKQVFTVLAFTFRDNIRKKTFIISTILMTLLIVGGCAIIGLISVNDDEKADVPTTPSYVCYYVDDDNLMPDALKTLSGKLKYISFKQGVSSELETYKSEITADDSVFAVTVTNGENNIPALSFTVKNFMTSAPTSVVADEISALWTAEKLTEAGVSSEMIELSRVALETSTVSAEEMNITGYIVGIIVLMLMFFAIYYYGYGVSTSVATEKTSRVMETLVVSAKPTSILFGKCIAMGLLGLAQFSYVLVLTVCCYKLMIPSGAFGMDISLSSLSGGNIVLILVYFLLGYALYAMMNSVCGASVSKIEDLQSAMMPVMFISLISFYVGYMAAVINSTGTIARVAQYIPFSAPFIMPFKLLNGGASVTEITISILLLVASIIIVAIFSAKIYSASVLHYGNRLKFKDMKKMVK